MIYKKLSAVILIVFLIACSLTRTVFASSETVGTVHFDMNKMRLTVYSRCSETLIGDICADAIRDLTGTDLALLNSGLIIRIFHNGEVSLEDLKNVFSEDEKLYVGEITAQQLAAYLEHAVSRVTITEKLEIDPEASDNEEFAQIAGFCFEYDVSAPYGSRITRIWIGSSEVNIKDDKTLYSLTVPASALLDETVFSKDTFSILDVRLSDALVQFIRRGKGEGVRMDRIRMIGVPEKMVQKYPVLPIAIGLGILLILIYFWRRPVQRN